MPSFVYEHHLLSYCIPIVVSTVSFFVPFLGLYFLISQVSLSVNSVLSLTCFCVHGNSAVLLLLSAGIIVIDVTDFRENIAFLSTLLMFLCGSSVDFRMPLSVMCSFAFFP